MKRLELLDKHKEKMLNLPETGVGYHIVDVTLNSGRVLKGVTIINSSYMMVDEISTIKKENINNINIKK